MEKNYENLVIDFPDDGIARITMNRPERLNALTYGLVEDLHTALDFVDSQHEIRALIITGAGRGFCAGLDLTGFGKFLAPKILVSNSRAWRQQHIAELVHHMRDTRQPIIAAINGAVAGGDLSDALAILDTAVLQLNLVRHSSDWNFRMRY